MKIRPKIRIHKCVLNSKFHGNMQTIWRKSKEKRRETDGLMRRKAAVSAPEIRADPEGSSGSAASGAFLLYLL